MIPLVSVITPCYNGANYIAACIESVLAQTLVNWEMLIVDDCSTDNSAEIILSYVKKDTRIRFFQTNKPSGSPAIPRNIAIDNAKGHYFAFLDCDDLWLPRKLEEQYSYAEANNYLFVYSNYEKITSEGIRNERVITVKSQAKYSDILKSCEIPCLTAFLHRSCVGKLRFVPAPKEDYVFWLLILKQSIVAYNTNTTLALYRDSLASRSSDKVAMLKNQWKIVRHFERVNFFYSLYCMAIYSLKGLRKYIR